MNENSLPISFNGGDDETEESASDGEDEEEEVAAVLAETESGDLIFVEIPSEPLAIMLTSNEVSLNEALHTGHSVAIGKELYPNQL